MKNMKLTAALLALIAAAVFNPAAKAATGDVILGVYDYAGTGANVNGNAVSNSYEVDLGSYANLAFGETFNLGTTITNEFSADSTPDLLFSLAATGAGFGGGGLMGGDVAFTAATLPNIIVTSTPDNNITNLVTYAAASTNKTGTGTSSTGKSFQEDSFLNSNTHSFAMEVNYNGGNFGYGGGSTPSEILSSFPTASAAFYLVPNNSTTPNEVGVFSFSTLNGNTILSYEAAPEPSTYALFLCGGLMLFWMLKRRNAVA